MTTEPTITGEFMVAWTPHNPGHPGVRVVPHPDHQRTSTRYLMTHGHCTSPTIGGAPPIGDPGLPLWVALQALELIVVGGLDPTEVASEFAQLPSWPALTESDAVGHHGGHGYQRYPHLDASAMPT